MRLLDLNAARSKVAADLERYVSDVRTIVAAPLTSIESGIRLLVALRRASYEDLNQIQHEYATLRAIEWLIAEKIVPREAAWDWNPRQTGDHREPDVAASLSGAIVASGEVTTSPEPKGKIDERMRITLLKLSTMPGRRFYFVLTARMAARARTKIEKARWGIEVVQLPASEEMISVGEETLERQANG